MILEPGEQILVRVAAQVADDLDADVSYRAELAVPGVTGPERVRSLAARAAGRKAG